MSASEQPAATDAAAPSSSSSAPAAAISPVESASLPPDAPFHPLPSAPFCFDSSAAVRELYRRWDLTPTLCALRLRFTIPPPAPGDAVAMQAFVCSLLNSAAFRAQFRCLSSASSRVMQPLPPDAEVSRVSFRTLRTAHTDLHLFDRLWRSDACERGAIVHGSADDPIPTLEALVPAAASAAVSGTGAARAAARVKLESSAPSTVRGGEIRQCFEEQSDGGLIVADELRRALLNPDAESYELFSASDRQELLFVLLVHLLVGGGLNQYDLSVWPYLAALKPLAKDLLSVRTNRNTGAIEVTNTVLRVDAAWERGEEGTEKPLAMFGSRPRDPHHLLLLSIEPTKKQVQVYYFAHTQPF